MDEGEVTILERWYDASKGVTVVRIRCGGRILKGVAFCSPVDEYRQTKREGTYHAIKHACEAEEYAVEQAVILDAIRQGLFSPDPFNDLCHSYLQTPPALGRTFFVGPGDLVDQVPSTGGINLPPTARGWNNLPA